MTKQTRSIILAVCAVLFFIITPYILLYSLGYRIDVKNFTIVGTGGIYVKALPQGADIAIDSKLHTTTGFLTPSAFEQNLLPGPHTIFITKNGYYDYQKTLDIKENQVTKLEHIALIKKNIVFDVIKDPKQNPFIKLPAPDVYIIRSNALYYANIPAN